MTMKRCTIIASSSRTSLHMVAISKPAARLLHTPIYQHVATTSYIPSHFTIPQLLPFPTPTSPYESQGKGKGKGPESPKSNEEEVDDAEWQMRVGELFLLREGLGAHGQVAQCYISEIPFPCFCSRDMHRLSCLLRMSIARMLYSNCLLLYLSG